LRWVARVTAAKITTRAWSPAVSSAAG
jgi:hypothetical protein